MRSLSAIAAILLSSSLVAVAAGSVDGTWRGQIGSGDSAQPILMSLHTSDTTLRGSVYGSGSELGIQDGTIDGSTVKFKTVQGSSDHLLTVNCIGSIVDDSISFSCTTDEATPQTQEFVVKRDQP